MILTKEKINSVNLQKLIDEKINSSRVNELLLIVPTNRKIRSLKKEIISASPNQSTAKLNLETIGTFAANILFNQFNSKKRVLGEAASSVLMNESFKECRLKYFSNYKDEIPSGTLGRVKNVISEYKKNGVSPEKLKKESEKLTGSEKIKAEDIAEIFSVYNRKIKELSLHEIGDIYSEVNILEQGSFANNFRSLYPDVNLIIVQGFDEFTSPEIEIINSASEIKGAKLFLSFDYYEQNPLLFSHLNSCYNRFKDKKFFPVVDDEKKNNSRFIEGIRENLFNKETVKSLEYKENIISITASTLEKEVEIIAKEIKSLIINHKAEPEKICVAFNLISHYSPTIRDAFAVYGIPFNLTDRHSLSNSAPVISIINFLEILENDFFYKNIFRALSGGWLAVKDVNLSNLLNVSVNLKIISGLKNWEDSIHDVLEKIENSGVEDERKYLRRENYESARADIEEISHILSPFNRDLTPKEFLENLYRLINEVRVPEKLLNVNHSSSEEFVKAAATFIDTITELLSLIEREEGKDKKHPLKFYLNSLRTAVSSTRFNVKEKPGYGVQVTTLNEIRGLEFDYLFISGLCEGDFPTRYSPEIFFSGSYVRGELTHQTEERYLFYQSLCSWRKKLYLSYPLHDERREFAASNYLKALTALFEVTAKDEKEYEHKFYSLEEALKNYSLLKDEVDAEKINSLVLTDKLRIETPFAESPFTGFINHNLSGEALKKLGELPEKEYSISQLENYAKCPFKYFAERILRLDVIEEPSEDIEALEMGSLLHSILYEFYSILHERGISLRKAKGKIFADAEELIFSIAKEKLEAASYHSPLTFYEKERILGINGDRKNSILFKFLESEVNSDEGYVPHYFEKSFGSFNNESNILLELEGIKIRGKIDRIDINENEKTFKVVDYKLSGRKPSLEDIYSGISLQLPLYLFAAKEIIKVELYKDYKPASMEIYSLKFKEGDFGGSKVSVSRKKNISPEEELILVENIVKKCNDYISRYVKGISGGKFNVSELPNREQKVCIYCSFRSVCRIQEIN